MTHTSTPSDGPPRILAVEDVAVNRELICLFLEPRGYQVEVACDGAEAVEKVRASAYDLVLMDMQMPGMDGLQATRAIRALGGAYAELPIIALSANIVPDQVQRCLDAGMTSHLAKPFTSEILCGVVEKWAKPTVVKSNPVLLAFAEQAGWASVRGLLDMMLAQLDTFEACDVGDADALSHHAHALRGAASALGYGDLAKVCREIEEAAKGGSLKPAMVSLAFQATAITRGEIVGELARAA
jgi:CheY-like chemotaxis protein